MKKLSLLLLLAFAGFTAFSQATVDSTGRLLRQAKIMADSKIAYYNPQKSFGIYKQLAAQGNAEAMNGLGMLYSKGIGVTEDDQQALSWFEKSANSGYAGAWYNLALYYKNGFNAPQDFVKAYACYSKGAALNNALCLYGQGYMLYKGYGCAQNYEQAVAAFKKSAALGGAEGSYYMLGLSYRNGYGLPVNLDSAKYWLKRAAAYNDQRAILELASPTPENIDLHDVPALQPSAQAKTVNLKTGFKQVRNHLPADTLDGEYTGYAIKFDWSGKHIIGQSALKLKLKRKEKTITGEWEEEGQQGTVPLSGTLTDSAIVFNNTAYNRNDHYHQQEKALPVEFRDSRLNLVQSNDTVYLTGTLRLYGTTLREPQRPEFMMLIRTGANNHHNNYSNNHDQTSQNDDAAINTDSLHFVAYPNPFNGTLQLRYTLKKTARVSIIVSDELNGQIVYRSNPVNLAAGEYTNPIIFNGKPGNYIVTLQYGVKIKSAIVYKL